jgi:hypothetical protein
MVSLREAIGAVAAVRSGPTAPPEITPVDRPRRAIAGFDVSKKELVRRRLVSKESSSLGAHDFALVVRPTF